MTNEGQNNGAHFHSSRAHGWLLVCTPARFDDDRAALVNTLAKRRRAASRYDHPWPWLVRELFERHAFEPDVDLRDLADRWDSSKKQLAEWVRKHGFERRTTEPAGERG